MRLFLERHSRRRLLLALACVCIVAALLLSSGLIFGASLTVSTTNDVVDGDTSSITKLIANPGADGKISLREAVLAANKTSGTDTITLPAGTYTLTAGEMAVSSSLVINGASSATTVISGNASSRIFNSSSTMTLTNMTLKNAKASSGNGGAILKKTSSLTLTNVVLDGNTASNGAGGAVAGTGGTYTWNNVVVQNNRSSLDGGALYTTAGTLKLTANTFSANTAANGAGGAIWFTGTVATITTGVFKGNSASGGNGGAVYLVPSGSSTISSGSFTGNTASNGSAGAAYLSGAGVWTLSDTSFSSNTAPAGGGGVLMVSTASASSTLTRVTFDGNQALNGNGGGLLVSPSGSGATTTLTNVTVYNNSANSGGGVAVSQGSASLVNVTVANNSGPNGSGGLLQTGGTLKTLNTLVASNGSTNCAGSISSLGNNLDSGNTCGFSAATDKRNAVASLGSFGNNGGNTQTMTILAASQAINNGTATGAPTSDQRGLTRVGTTDIGAYEFGAGTTGASISGTVFEDVNYGGGAGRDLATAQAAGGSGRSAARVELYDSSGALARNTSSAVDGSYSFTFLPAGTYSVRVVNATVSSARTGWTSALTPVQTFRTDASSGAAVAVTDRVGGQTPSKADADAGSSTLAALATATTAAQSVTSVVLASTTITGVNFGYSFNLVVNTNDVGQGSLSQFVDNANALDNTGLAISGRTAGLDHAVFMLPDGTARAGMNTSYATAFSSGVATLNMSDGLVITDPVVIDGQTQPGWTANPIIELNGSGAGTGTPGIDAGVGGTALRGLIINRFDGGGVFLDGGSNTVQGCWIGLAKTGTAASANNAVGLQINGGSGDTIGGVATSTGNVISGNAGGGVIVLGSATLIQGNRIGTNAAGTAKVANGSDGIQLSGAVGVTVGGTSAAARNIISGNDNTSTQADGIWIVGGGSNAVYGNYIGTDLTGTVALANYHGGVTIYGSSNNIIGGTGSGEANLIARNTGAGVIVSISGGSGTATGNRISGNSIQNNGGQGIDLGEDGVSANNGTVSAALPNNGYDFPVITSASLAGTTLAVSGYVGSAAGQSTFSGAKVEVFVADTTSAGNGEGQTYLGFVTADASGNFNGTIAGVSGLTSGTTRVTATATDSSGNTSEFGANFVVTTGAAISGAVFEDVNYGGSAGRNKAAAIAAGGSARPGARVELFSVSGSTATVLAVATTDASGNYNFAGLSAGNYGLRVVSSTVTSARTGYVSTLVGVTTYRADGSSGTATDVTNEVGGGAPAVTGFYNVPANVGTQSSTSVAYAEAIGYVSLASGSVAGMDFGFNFNTVTNLNDSGPGSLRQVITNASTLGGDSALAQAGRSAGVENVVFMISNGTTGSGGSLGLSGGLRTANSYFSAGVATIAPASALPEVTGMVIDAQAQPGWTAAPIFEINGTNAGASVSGLTARGGSTLRGLVINRFKGAGVQFLDAGGNVLQGSYIGTSSAGSAASANAGVGVNIFNSPNNTIGGTAAAAGNVISGNGGIGLNLSGTGAGMVVQGNIIGLNAAGTARLANGSIGLYVASGSATIGGTSAAARNVIAGSTYENVQFASTANGSTFQGNYVGTSGSRAVGISNGSDGVWINGASNVQIGGTASGAGNTIAGNNGRGLTITGTGSGNLALGNSIFGNANIGIDLGNDGLTANDGAKTASQPNLKMDFPVFTSSSLSGTTLTVAGYVGSVAGQSTFANARVEVFVSDTTNPNGQGKTYLGAVTTDAGGNISGTIAGVSSGANGTLTITGTATDASNNTSEFGPNALAGLVISGTVFEDIHYGGGAGRSLAASGGAGVAGARVELYDASGNYLNATTTIAGGTYSFNGLGGATTYFVRVVNSTVLSTRSGSSASLVPVMTYRTESTAGTANGVTNEVGGSKPAAADAGAGASGTSMWTLCAGENATCSFTGTRTVRYGVDGGGVTGWSTLVLTGGTVCSNGVFGDPIVGYVKNCYLLNADYQSVSTVRVVDANVPSVDFGFNFDTVVNTNDSGAGSLRQAITNANALGGDASLAQSGRTAAIENLIFMLSNGSNAAGLRAGNNYFTTPAGSTNVATIALASQLPALSSTLVMDAQAQPGWSANPVVQISGTGAANVHGLNVTASGVVLRGLIVSGFSGGNGIYLNTGSSNAVVQGCWVGTTAAGTAAAANGYGIYTTTAGHALGGNSATARNVVSGNTNYGIWVAGASNTVAGNYLGTNAAGTTAVPNGSHGLHVTGVSATVGGLAAGAGNLASGNSGSGIALSAPANGSVVQGNVLGLAADGSTALANTTSALVVWCSTGCTIGGTSAAARNVISASTSGHGINLQGSGSLIQGNYIGTDVSGTLARGASGHGIYVNTGASNQTIGGTAAGAGNLIRSAGSRGVAIDTGSSGIAVLGNSIFGNASIGIDLTSDGITANDGAKTAGAANLLMDFPVFTAATAAGVNLTVSGYVGSAAGQSTFAGARVEIFVSDGSNANGQGKTYLGALTADASGNFTGTLAGASGLTNGTSIVTATATDGSNNTSEFGPNMVVGMTVGGTVFEDANYGGGAGRSLSSSGGTGVAGVTVELYNSSGAFVRSAVSGSGGSYTLTGLAAGNYYVRVVGSTVLSQRTGSSASLLPVLTYRTTAISGTAVAVTDAVGGTIPAQTDPGAASSGAAFNTSTFVFGSGLSGTAQAVAPLTMGSSAITALDFGFNFDTVVNTNASGAGSLAQAITNANALGGDGSLVQSGRTPGIENLVFMIGNGTAAAGLRSSVNYFSAGVATITPAAALPTISSALVLDAQTQPGWSANPLIELNGTGAGNNNGLVLNAAGSIVRGFIINRWAYAGIRVTANGTVQGNWLGTASSGLAAAANGQHGLEAAGGTATVGGTGVAQGNVLSGNAGAGMWLSGGTGHLIQGNLIGLGYDGSTRVANTGFSGIEVYGSGGYTIGGTSAGAGNTISGQTGAGKSGIYLCSSNNSVLGNRIGTNAAGSAAVANAGTGISVCGGVTGNTIGGTASGAANLISGNATQGVAVSAGSTGNAMQRNRIYGNGGIAIDLANDGVTANDGAKTNGSANLLMDSPVITAARATGSQLVLTGYVGSTPGQSVFASASVEIFVSDNDASGSGGGKTWLGTLVADGSGNFSGTLTMPLTSIPIGSKLSGTATDSSGNTSEFGVNFSGLIVDLVVNDNGDAVDANAGDGSCLTAAGVCTLRAAIAELNAWSSLATSPTIAFAIPGCTAYGAAACTITPATALPSITKPLLLDGSTQSGFSTSSYLPIIELNGAAAPAGTTGLVVAASNATVRGLTINRFSANGITFSGSGNTLVGMRIGLAAYAATAAGNGGSGVYVTGAGSVIGGGAAADRNTVAGNGGAGVSLLAGTATLVGNNLGTDSARNASLGNGGHGIVVAASGLSGIAVSANTVANNGGAGVVVLGSSRAQITTNSTSGNGGLGIDLGADGVTANSGTASASLPDNGMNFPVITGAGVGTTAMTIYGYIGTGTGQALFAGARVEFFKAAPDASGYGEGQVYLGALTADSGGRFSGSVTFSAGALAQGDVVTATATDSSGSTSEFGPNVTTTSIAGLMPGSFNAFDAGTAAGALTGPITSKVAGTAASLAVVALDSSSTALHPGFTGTVTLSWVDARNDSGVVSGSCRSSWVDQGVAGSAVFNNSNRVTVALTPPASATRVMRLKMGYTANGSTTTACSNDAFAAMPASLGWINASDADAATAGIARVLGNGSASGGVVHKAGRPFTVRAQALDATGALMTGYDGSPVLSAAGCLLPSGCTAATLTAIDMAAVAGNYTHSTVSYAEVGALQLQLTDSTYAAVDAADTPANVRSFSSTLLSVGRFVPDAYTVTVATSGQLATANSACMASGTGATFMGQGFGWATAPQLSVRALNAAGATTARWTGSLMKLTPGSGLQETLTASGAGSASLSTSYGTMSVQDLGGGLAMVTAGSTDRFLLDLGSGVLQESVTPGWAWSATVTDASEAGVAGNPTLGATGSQASVPFNNGGVFHSGRLSLSPGYGDVRTGVHLLAQLQRYTSAGWVTLTEDRGCVTVLPQNLGVESPVGVFTTLGSCAAPMQAGVTTRGGRAWLSLPATPAGAPGRLTVRLAGGGASGNSCTAAGASATLVPLALPWLLGGASASGPQAWATWGTPQRDAILRREIW